MITSKQIDTDSDQVPRKTMSLRIAVFGIRALPSVDGCGGAETFAEELYTRLAEREHEVTVYCRRYFGDKKRYPNSYRNLNIIYLPTFKRVGLDTFFHSFLCMLHIVAFNTGKVIHIHNAGNSLFVPVLNMFGKKCLISMDGIDWNRKRWNFFVRLYLRITNFLALYVSHKVIVDNILIKKYYRDNFRKDLEFIPYGSNIRNVKTRGILEKLNLAPKRYILFVGRFSREKGVHYLIKAFEKTLTDLKLVLVGDDMFDQKWVDGLKTTTDTRIIFTGFLYGDSVDELIQHCYLYVQPSDVEGLSPVILRVMGLGKCVLSSDIPENRFLVDHAGFLFVRGDVDSLHQNLSNLLSRSDLVDAEGEKARNFVEKNYSWDHVADRHEKIFLKAYFR